MKDNILFSNSLWEEKLKKYNVQIFIYNNDNL